MSYINTLKAFESASEHRRHLTHNEYFKYKLNSNGESSADITKGCSLGFLAYEKWGDTLSHIYGDHANLGDRVADEYGMKAQEKADLMHENDSFRGSDADRFQHILQFLRKKVEMETGNVVQKSLT